MRTLVTGGTGFLGQHLVQRLLLNGDSVRVLTRSATKVSHLADIGAEAIVSEITDREGLRAALEGVELVYHLAGKLFTPGASPTEYHRVHVEGTAMLLACCQEQSKLKRFVHVSTTGVLGVTGNRPADENAPCAPTNAYESSKWKSELLVHEAFQQHLPSVIVRPGLVYGPGDLHLLGFFRTIQHRLFRPIGTQSVWLHPIYVNDLTDALMRCGHRQEAVGHCFNIAGQNPVTIAKLSVTIASAIGAPPPRGTIPLPVARVIARIGEFLPSKLKALAPLTRSRLDFLTHSRVYNVMKAERLLGFTAKTELSAGIARTVTWYRQQGYLRASI